ncbi:hypothetical protein [Chenggangzhangella methanolivorans]|uniref:DUF2782 domain-containing protein n=1 Tax=Chenggangzhangella methanolivorans TaxID=1437009 RepID=A0A9E6UHS2_9HYPH|nr:hypothetical protein [Chenggangzhangella methanolivorans]QZO00048.1 hypothetical protein K6K41_26335 [Chenggangzhangella methanolivorans]
MKTSILTLCATIAALALASAAQADEIVTRSTTSGVYSAPVAGATPQARDHPAPDTTMREVHKKTTVEHVPGETTVIRQGGSVDAEGAGR